MLIYGVELTFLTKINLKLLNMAQLKKLTNFLESFDDDLKEEIYNREEKASDQIDKWSAWEESEKGTEYIYKTESLDELRDKIFEVIEQAEKIINKDYY